MNSGKSLALIKLNCSKNSCSGGRSANISVIVAATCRPVSIRSSVSPSLSSTAQHDRRSRPAQSNSKTGPIGVPNSNVLGNRRIRVEAPEVVGLDQLGDAVRDQSLRQRVAGFEQARRDLGLLRRIEPAAQSKGVDVLLEVEARQHLGNALRKLLRVGDLGAFVIDPIGMQIEIDVAGAPRLEECARPLARGRLVIFGRPHRVVAQPEQQVVAQGSGKNVRRVADIADAPADDGDRQIRYVPTADRDPAAARLDQPREQQGKLVFSAAALADDRDMLAGSDGKAHRIDDPALVILGEREIGDSSPRRSAAPRFRVRRAAAGCRPSPAVGTARRSARR